MKRRNTSVVAQISWPDETYDFHRENDRETCMHNLFSWLFDHERVRRREKRLGGANYTGCRVARDFSFFLVHVESHDTLYIRFEERIVPANGRCVVAIV